MAQARPSSNRSASQLAYKSLIAQTLHYFGRPHHKILRTPITGASAWRGEEMSRRDDWQHRLGADDIEELEAAVRHVGTLQKPTGALTKQDFPLPTLQHKIAAWRRELSVDDAGRQGRGFVLVRGVPVQGWSEVERERFFWCFGLHLGEPGAQNPQGDLLGHVRDTGEDPTVVRHYRTAININFHCDAADVVGLLCLQKAKSGGESRIVSSVSVYNELLRRRPDLVERLYRPFHLDTHGEGGIPYIPIAPVRHAGGRLRTFYHTDYFRSAPKRPGARPLSDADAEVLDVYNDIASSPELYLDMSFEPGDIQLVSNHTILHARTAYEDFDAPEQRRHLLRLWLSLPTHTGQLDRWRARRAKAGLVARLLRLRARHFMSS